MTIRRTLITLISLALISVLTWLVWFLFFQTPAQQIERAQRNFFAAVEKRKWDKIKATLKDDYVDEIGYDKETGLAAAQQAFSGFFTLEIQWQTTKILGTINKVNGNETAPKALGFIETTLRLEGNGTVVAQAVQSRVNELKSPWVFHWHKTGRWPWDWQLVQIHNDGLK
jgi:hypothetical protein